MQARIALAADIPAALEVRSSVELLLCRLTTLHRRSWQDTTRRGAQFFVTRWGSWLFGCRVRAPRLLRVCVAMRALTRVTCSSAFSDDAHRIKCSSLVDQDIVVVILIPGTFLILVLSVAGPRARARRALGVRSILEKGTRTAHVQRRLASRARLATEKRVEEPPHTSTNTMQYRRAHHDLHTKQSGMS